MFFQAFLKESLPLLVHAFKNRFDDGPTTLPEIMEVERGPKTKTLFL